MSKIKLITYALYLAIFSLGLILLGELTAQVFSIRQLNKVTGKIIKIEARVTSYSSGSSFRLRRGQPNYSLVITLDNHQYYDFDLSDDEWQIQDILHNDSVVTIYYPTVLYDLLSLNILEFGHKGSQLEYKGHVLYRFNQQKRDSWLFTGLIAALIAVACYRLYGVLHGE